MFNSGSIHLDKKHAYYYQVQTQIFVCEVAYCDFCICTFPESGPSMHIERIYPDPEFWHVCVSKAEHFFKVCILPELVGKWYTRPIQNELAHLQLVLQLQSAKLQNPQNIFTATVNSQNPQMALPRQK